MTKPESFISNTDYATLKNDSVIPGILSVILPGGVILSAGQIYTTSTTLSIGTINASSRIRVASSKDGGAYYAGLSLVATRTGFISGPVAVPYSVIAYLSRTSPTVITATISTANPYGENMIMAFGDEIFTFEISTFLSPFV